jgi:hypothetical protein
MAPGLSKIILYEAPNPSPFEDILNRMATDNVARQLSCSWYNPNSGPDPVADQIFLQMAAQGQSFLNASGDFDAWTSPIPFPGESPYITQVGGTTLTTDGPGGPWFSETVWNWGEIGSGGGISTDYPIPAWQTNVSMAGNQGSTATRNTPDVALTADNVYVRANGQDLNVGGTSCAAPLWAGFTALVNQQAAAYGAPPPGFLNPTIYRIGLGAGYLAAFHDITIGDNTSPDSPGKFFAVPGYDLCTGWGTPIGQGLIDALAQPPAATPPSIITQPQSQTVPAGSNAVFVVAVTGSPVMNYQWSVNGTNIDGETNALLLLANVQPNQAGNYSVQVTNSFGAVFSSNAVLTVEPPIPPVVVAQPQDQVIAPGGLALFSVTITGTPPAYQWTFNSNPIPGATNNPLILFNVQSTDAGLYAVQITNAAGGTVSSNATLSVLPPGTSCESDASGLVGWWAAEGNAYNAAAGGQAAVNGVAYTSGKVGQAFNFDGKDSIVDVAPNASLDVGSGNGFSMEAWINPSNISQPSPLLQWGHPLFPYNGLLLWISIPPLYGGNGPGSLILDVGDITTFEVDHYAATPPGLIQSNTWQHVAATYDKTSGIACLYINGSLLVQTNLAVLNAWTAEDLWLGFGPISTNWSPRVFGAQAHYTGLMDEVLVYNRALSAAEIQATYNVGSYGLCPLAPATVSIVPANQTAFAGNTVTLTAVGNGSQPLNYQWSLNGTNITGAATATLTLTNVQLDQAGSYAVVAGNGAGSVQSSNAFLTVLPSYPAWMLTAAPVLDWQSVACSADGMQIVAVSYNGQIYTSTNFGITWISNNVPGLTWYAATCSTDGSKIAAAAATISGGVTGGLYSSTNSGATWQPHASGSFLHLVGSAQGDKLILSDVSKLYASTNFGSSWRTNSSGGFTVRACSADETIVVGAKSGLVSVSTNSGVTWNPSSVLSSSNNILQAASSSDGTIMLAAVDPGYIFRSTNSGTTWAPITPFGFWRAIACSSDGTKLVAALDHGAIYTSADSGATWSPANAPIANWQALAASADGNKLIAVCGYPYGPIYTWQIPTLNVSPSTNQLCLSWLTNTPGFTLQENADLSTTNWLNVTNPVTVTNWFNQVFVSPSGSQFYRLKYH